MNLLQKVKREEGQGLVEYALVLVLIAVIVIVILSILGSSVVLVYARVIGGFSGQTITGTDNEGIVVGVTMDQIGSSDNCSASDLIVVLTTNGSIVTDTTATVTLTGGYTASVTVNGNGIGRADTVTGVGTCNANLKITGW